MKCYYTQEAIADLERIRTFLVENYPTTFSGYIEELIERVTKLGRYPRLGSRIVSTNTTLELREIVVGSYVVRYLILEQSIMILRIWYGREDR